METRPVKFREWSLWLIAWLPFAGVSVESVRDWIKARLPSLTWLVGTISVPWLAILFGTVLIALAAYHVGRRVGHTAANAAADAVAAQVRTGTKTPSAPFEPDEIQAEIVRVLRFLDRQVLRGHLLDTLTKLNKEMSSREIELAIDGLLRQGWLRPVQLWNVVEYETGYELEEPAMAYAKAMKFPHIRSTPNC
ncbi:hypothetical protein ABIE56_000926 [Luteibacter sp. 621]|uniref:hypothetical protein n=1 Tax=Luteibacter sp. 621 TaxID=3373916 RepID=UPI003D1BB59E